MVTSVFTCTKKHIEILNPPRFILTNLHQFVDLRGHKHFYTHDQNISPSVMIMATFYDVSVGSGFAVDPHHLIIQADVHNDDAITVLYVQSNTKI